jgi:hypothetical protein
MVIEFTTVAHTGTGTMADDERDDYTTIMTMTPLMMYRYAPLK